MTEFTFTQASKEQRKARIFLSGPSGSGKTYTALIWAGVFGKRVGVIDTENDSALDYAPRPGETADPAHGMFEFEHLSLTKPYTVPRYTSALDAAAQAGLDVVILDSASHAWAGKGGLLELVDRYGAAHKGDNFSGWREATPRHLDFIEAMLSTPFHLIVTTRAKQDYQLEKNQQGKWEPVKLGLAPIQREGLEYEFAVAADMTVEHALTVTKTRCAALDGYTELKPGPHVAEVLVDWLGHGRPVAEVAEALFGQAQDADTSAALLALRERARVKGAGRVEVVDPDTGEISMLDAYIARRGKDLWTKELTAAGERSP